MRNIEGKCAAAKNILLADLSFRSLSRNFSSDPKMFELLAQDRQTKARRGRLTTAHGVVETPAFIPVGTQGSVKGVSPRELRELEAEIILGNTYHLFVRPGLDVIRHFGGLHRFMNWNGPILTDSAGFQNLLLAQYRTHNT